MSVPSSVHTTRQGASQAWTQELKSKDCRCCGTAVLSHREGQQGHLDPATT